MNMFKPVNATTITEYLDQITGERRDQVDIVHAFIQKTAPDLQPHFANNMIGYGSFKYSNYKKEIIDWPVIALASQKNYISVYVCAIKDGEYLAELFKDKLGKVSVGKSCIRFKKISDINFDTLETVIKIAARSPGLDKNTANK